MSTPVDIILLDCLFDAVCPLIFVTLKFNNLNEGKQYVFTKVDISFFIPAYSLFP